MEAGLKSSLKNSSYFDDGRSSLYERAMIRNKQKGYDTNVFVETKVLKEAKDLSECTFKPDTTLSQNFNSINKRSMLNDIKGFDKHNSRLKFAKDKKAADEELYENLGSTKIERLKRTQDEFLSDKHFVSVESDANRESDSNPIILTVDVSISKNKTGKISIRKNDDPEELAGNFAKTYNLSDEVQLYLKEMLKEYKQKF